MASSNLAGTAYNVYRGIEGKITATPATIPELGPKDILIKLTHTGICYTDREFYRVGAPLALGHEGAGVAVAVGSDVKSVKPGDRVGGGFHKDACGHCKYCLSGNDIQCYERVIFGEGDYNNGTFAPYYIGKETFVHKIPDGLASEHAAPLQCAGATTYNALADTVKTGDRVGIVGIGGLGHLAIQFAKGMGTEVVVFSTSKDKEEEARGFGASEFILLNAPETISKPVDVLIVASNKYPDWSKFMTKNVLARGGTIVPLAAPMEGPISLPADRMFWDLYHIHSSLVASRARHDEMLQFAATHGVKPAIELTKHTGADSITKAIERLETGKARYRLVLEFE